MNDIKVSNYTLNGTKAETLKQLQTIGYKVPDVYFFTVLDWRQTSNTILTEILNLFCGNKLAVRSSTKAEDTEDSSMAGAFESLLNVNCDKVSIRDAVDEVMGKYDLSTSKMMLIFD